MSETIPPAPERRAAPRVESQLLVKFRSASDTPGKWHMTPLKDMSADGLRFTSEVPYAPGTTLELQLLLPTTATPLHLLGCVRWSRPSLLQHLIDCGIELVNLQPSQRADIDKIVTLYRSRKHPAR